MDNVLNDNQNITDDKVINSNIDLESKLAEAEEAKLKALADYQNLKKRTEEELKEIKQIMNGSFINKNLDLSDDFGRAIEYLEKEVDKLEKADIIYQIKAIAEKLKQNNSSFGIEEIKVQSGTPFDSITMEAVTTVKAENEEDIEKVATLISKGYKFSDTGKIIRPAKVIVYN